MKINDEDSISAERLQEAIDVLGWCCDRLEGVRSKDAVIQALQTQGVQMLLLQMVKASVEEPDNPHAAVMALKGEFPFHH